MNLPLRFWTLTIAVLFPCLTVAADPWADRVVNYTPGSGLPTVFGSDPPEFFDQSEAALGSPSRASGGFVVSPYSSAYTPTDIVALGEGGSLTVAFDEPVLDDPNNPFGIDLLIFGNAFFTLSGSFPYSDDATISGIVAEGGVIEVSADGVNYVTIPGIDPDGLYPTNGYADSTGFFPSEPGGVLSDFTRPVDPAYDPIGDTSAELYAAYNGSGGGAGIDLGAVGLASASFVKITNPVGSGFTPEIDGFADVRAIPEPTAILLLALGLVPLTRRSR